MALTLLTSLSSLGCIQALICDTERCPVGIATQNPALYKGLDPANKSVRVFNLHLNTIKATKEMMEACGFLDTESIHASKIFRKIDSQITKSFEEIYFKKLSQFKQQQIFNHN